MESRSLRCDTPARRRLGARCGPPRISGGSPSGSGRAAVGRGERDARGRKDAQERRVRKETPDEYHTTVPLVRPFPALSPLRTGFLVFLSALLLAPVPAPAVPGDLDPSFDGDGRVLTDFRSGRFSNFNFVSALAVQPNGKLVAAGGSLLSGGGVDFVLARYNRDGSLDTNWPWTWPYRRA